MDLVTVAYRATVVATDTRSPPTWAEEIDRKPLGRQTMERSGQVIAVAATVAAVIAKLPEV